MTTPTIDVTEIQVEPCQVSFGPHGFLKNLGATDGGVSIIVKQTWVDITADQTGKVVLDKVKVGEEVSVKFDLIQENEDNMKFGFPDWTSSGGGIAFGNLPGFRAMSASGELCLHPQYASSANKSRDFVLFHAGAPEVGDMKRTVDKKYSIPITIHAMAVAADLAKGNGLWAYGDIAGSP